MRPTAQSLLPLWLAGAVTATALEPAKPGDLWALKPVTSPQPPAVSDKTWARSDIDNFVLTRLEAAGLKPSPEADRRTLLRRLHFDLTGLPPSYREVLEFERDTSPDAYAKVVDRLLSSPAFGERWARHWLDVARYADSKGYVFEESRDYPYAYAYRDWVIRAFNDDLPYDQFLLYQIAADKAATAETDKHHLAAMGFLTVGRRFLNREPDIIDDRIDVTFRGTMALTVACARCHDHTYDPVPTADYYSLYGVFASSQEPADLPLLNAPPDTDVYRKFEAEIAAKQKKIDDYLAGRAEELLKPEIIANYLMAAQETLAGNDEQLKNLATKRKLLHKISLRWRTMLKDTTAKHDPVFATWHAFAKTPPETFATVWQKLKSDPEPPHPALRAMLDAALPKNLGELADTYGKILSKAGGNAALKKAIAHARVLPQNAIHVLDRPGINHVRNLRKELEGVKTKHPGAPPRGMVMVDRQQPREPHIFERGDPGRVGKKVPRQFLAMTKGDARMPFSDGSGRLEMAREITSKDNPLTARVWANRIWGHLFGGHLVSTPSDFGSRSDPPTHPLLLDHLARQLMDSGWSSKQLVRKIVLSATYRQQAGGENVVSDPENRLYGRANRRRLDFESLRDGMLAVSGDLDKTRFGRPVEISGDSYSKRRTIYGRVERQNLPPVFRTFDFASPDVHIAKRPETSVPQQALFMMNGKFAQDRAANLLQHPQLKNTMKDEDRVRLMYRLVFARAPLAEEISDALAFIGTSQTAPRLGAWEYGYGSLDAKQGTIRFEPLPHLIKNRWQGGGQLPDPKLGWVSLHAGGGHPGDKQHSAIWRWTVPLDGRYDVRGKVELPSPQSDGVFATIFAGEGKRLALTKIAPAGIAPLHLDSIELKRGQILYFAVASGETENFDSFRWDPQIRERSSGRSWSASKGFSEHNATTMASLWEQFAQALLASNEFTFID